MRLHRRLAAVSAALLAGPLLVVAPAQAAPDEGGKAWSPTLISSQPLYDGSAVLLRYTEGITVVAPVGAEVFFQGSETPTTRSGGRSVYDRAVQIKDPHSMTSRSSIAGAAADYRAAGRSVYTDALAAGFSPEEARREAQWQDRNALAEPPIASSGCVYSETNYPDPEYEWAGCYKLYAVTDSDPNAWYGAGSGTARGWGTGILTGKMLEMGYSQVSWSGTGVEIIEASPGGSVSGANCSSFQISLSHYIGVGYTVPLCDDGWRVTWNPTVHRVEWYGENSGGSSDQVAASGASTFRAPWSTPSVGMSYRIGWRYACFC